MKFGQLKTGDVMTLAGTKAVVLSIDREHPLNPQFMLVIWYLFGQDQVTMDQLHPDYDLIPGAEIHEDGKRSWVDAMNRVHRK